MGSLSLVAAVSLAVAALDLSLGVAPSALPRSGDAALTATLDHSGGATLDDVTLHVPLPVGFDQLASTCRVDGGAWVPFPPNGVILLGSIPPGQRVIEIRAPVEHGAPSALTVTAEAHDAAGLLDATSLQVNVLPAVDAGADLLVDLGESIALDGASTGDGGDALASLAWTDHGAGGQFDDSGTLHPTYSSAPVSGLVELTLTATDLDGGAASDSLWLRVNARPTLDVGGDRSVDEGGQVSLDDAMATDIDGTIVSTAWSDGGAGGTFLPSAFVLHPVYVAPQIPGSGDVDIELTLVATDNWGAEATDQLIVTVRNVNSPPVVSAGSDLTASEGSLVELSGATVSDPDGTIVSTVWNDGGDGGSFLPSAGDLHPTYRVPEIEGCADGEIELSLTVTDDRGGVTVDTIVLFVESSNDVPTVDAGSDRNARPGDVVSLAAVASDPDGSIVSVDWTQVGGATAAVEPAPDPWAVRVFVTDAHAGEALEFRVDATDDCGAMASDAVSILVTLSDSGPGVDEGILAIRIEAFDQRGLPVIPREIVEFGEEISFRITVTNQGDIALNDITAADDQGAVALGVTSLASGGSGSFVVHRQVQADETGRFIYAIEVLGVDADGRMTIGRETFPLEVRSPDAAVSLEVEVDRVAAVLGDSIVYSYVLRNTGAVPLVGLALIDDLLGIIALPMTRAEPGDSIRASAVHTVRGPDLPGPLTSTTTASGFTRGATPVEDEVRTSVELGMDPAGSGGAAGNLRGGRMVISEVAWAGTPGAPDAEWIELANLGPDPVELDGWALCWYEKGFGIPDEETWTRIELSGVVEPLPGLSPEQERLVFIETETGMWCIEAARWGGDSASGEASAAIAPMPGFFVLERGHDGVLSDIPADQLYDFALTLPDGGAALFLIDPTGEIVDTANAEYPTSVGWPAGHAETAASMERCRLHLGDTGENWQTHPGVLCSGRDANGRSLCATAGKPNGPSLDALIEAAKREVLAAAVESTASFELPAAGTGGAPRIRATASADVVAGAGGGFAATPELSTSRTGTWCRLDVDLADVPAGVVYIWISYPDGRAFLLPLSKGEISSSR